MDLEDLKTEIKFLSNTDDKTFKEYVSIKWKYYLSKIKYDLVRIAAVVILSILLWEVAKWILRLRS